MKRSTVLVVCVSGIIGTISALAGVPLFASLVLSVLTSILITELVVD